MPILLTVGFALGIGFGWMFFRSETPAASKPLPNMPSKPVDAYAPTTRVRKDVGTLAEVERQFQRWGGYAVWSDDVTEIALWREQTKRRDDFYEVRRVGGKFYFRTLARLSQPVIDHGVRSNLPVEFTETQALHDEFHRAHPDYDRTKEPIVELPPRPPEPSAESRRAQGLAVPPLTPSAGEPRFGTPPNPPPPTD